MFTKSFFFKAQNAQSFSPGRETAGVGADTITSINLPGARCIFITNMIGIQITEQASMSHPSTMDQLGSGKSHRSWVSLVEAEAKDKLGRKKKRTC